MQLYFIRHGQSVNNAGWGKPGDKENPDPFLTDIGIEQAQRVAEHLGRNQEITQPDTWNAQNEHGYGITHVYASLMERAALTAVYTANGLGIPFEGVGYPRERWHLWARRGDKTQGSGGQAQVLV